MSRRNACPATHPVGFINAYLVRELDSWTVLDTTLPGLGKPIAKAAQDRGLPIGRVLLTHAHGDHVGSLDELASEPGHVDVAISGRDARLLAKSPRRTVPWTRASRRASSRAGSRGRTPSLPTW